MFLEFPVGMEEFLRVSKELSKAQKELVQLLATSSKAVHS